MKKIFPLVSIVISNHNGKNYLDRCIRSIKKLDYPADKIEIIIVDNISTDGSGAYIKKRYPKVILLKNSENNYCKGDNMAIKKARGGYIALLNNDTELDKNWLKELIKVMQSRGKAGALTSKILFMDGKIQSTGHQEYPNFYWGDRGFKEKDRGQYNRIQEVPSICGASVLYRRKCLEDVGFLDEDFIIYMEDVDMSIRCRDKKWKLFYVPKSIVRHAYNGTATNDLQSYYVERNRLLLIAKHYPKKLPDELFGRGYFAKSNFRKLEDILPVMVNKLVKSGHENNIVEMALKGLFVEIGKLNNKEKDSYYKEMEEIDKKILDKEALIKEKDLRLKENSSLFAVKDKDLAARDIVIRKKDKMIALLEKKAHDIKRLEAELKDRDKIIIEKDRMIKERDSLVKENSSLFAVKDKDLAARDAVIKEKGVDIISKDKKIYSLNTELAKTLESFQEQAVELELRGKLLIEKKSIISERDEIIRRKDQEMVSIDKELRIRDAEIQRLSSDLMKFSYDIKILEKDIKEKETIAAQWTELIKDKGKEIISKDNELIEKKSIISERDEIIRRKDQEMVSIDKELRIRDAEIQRLSSDLMKFSYDIKILEKDIKEKETIAAQWTELIKDKGKEIISKDNELIEKKSIISERDEIIRRKDQEMVSIDKELRIRDAEIQRLSSDLMKFSYDIKILEKDIKEKETIAAQWTELIKDKGKEIISKDNELIEKKSIISERDEIIRRKDQEMVSIDKELRIRDAEIQRLSSDLMKFSYDIKILEKDIKEKETIAAQWTELIKDKGKEIISKDNELIEKKSIISERDEIIRRKDQEMVSIDKELRIRDAEIQRLCAESMKLSYDFKLCEKDLQEKDKAIISQDELIRQKDAETISKDNIINKLSLDIESLYLENALHIRDKETIGSELQKIRSSIFYKAFHYPVESYIIKVFLRFKYMLKGVLAESSSRAAKIKRSLCYNRLFMKLYDSNTPIARILQALHRRENSWLKVYNKHIKYGKNPPKPEKLTLMLTKRCNLKCEFCDIHSSSDEMRAEDAFKVIDNASRLGIRKVVITGGEPFLHKDIFKIIRYMADKAMEVYITTNGFLILDNIDDILKSKINCLAISMDGIGAAHDELRGKSGVFEKVQRGIEELLKHKINIALGLVITKKNIGELEKVYSWARERNITCDFWPVNYCKELDINLNGDYRLLSNFVKKLRRSGEIRRCKYYYFKKTPLLIKGSRLKMRCLGLSRDIGIDVNGDILPCCVWGKDRAHLGNAIRDDIVLLWNSKRYHQVRRDIFYKGCSAGCYNNSLHEFMTITGHNFIVNCKKDSK